MRFQVTSGKRGRETPSSVRLPELQMEQLIIAPMRFTNNSLVCNHYSSATMSGQFVLDFAADLSKRSRCSTTWPSSRCSLPRPPCLDIATT
nr:hypothetical protein CFP56_20690 [Quercus suber]